MEVKTNVNRLLNIVLHLMKKTHECKQHLTLTFNVQNTNS